MISCIVGVNFEYHDPEQGFDRNKVKGVVAKLVHLQDLTTTTALEVAAGGKLYQVLMLCPCCLAGMCTSLTQNHSSACVSCLYSL